MRCLLALTLLTLAVALAQDQDFTSAQFMCPELNPADELPCTQPCLTSQDCVGDTMCCPSACGHSCKIPTKVVHKAGVCPWEPKPQNLELCAEQNQCSEDADCDGDNKCCFRKWAIHTEPQGPTYTGNSQSRRACNPSSQVT
uniref:WAP domain-containing protein n=1 Tax=Castor canadensis TaxID=51338 RepID=A0A8C0X881_CASCN